jgi:hypothetical protein
VSAAIAVPGRRAGPTPTANPLAVARNERRKIPFCLVVIFFPSLQLIARRPPREIGLRVAVAPCRLPSVNGRWRLPERFNACREAGRDGTFGKSMWPT